MSHEIWFKSHCTQKKGACCFFQAAVKCLEQLCEWRSTLGCFQIQRWKSKRSSVQKGSTRASPDLKGADYLRRHFRGNATSFNCAEEVFKIQTAETWAHSSVYSCARARVKMIITAAFSSDEPQQSSHYQFYKVIVLRGQLQSSEASTLSHPPHIASALPHLSANTKVKWCI